MLEIEMKKKIIIISNYVNPILYGAQNMEDLDGSIKSMHPWIGKQDLERLRNVLKNMLKMYPIVNNHSLRLHNLIE